MKNIHVIQTNKPSRLFYDISMDKLVLASTSEVSKWFENKNIYITSDEEIKEGDWYYHSERKTIHNTLEKVDYFVNNTKYDKFKKIILTTDQDLIKDGVQAIGDEFLEWFVKNPSCEEVEWKVYPIGPNGNIIGTDKPYPFNGLISNFKIEYKIIIPKGEPKQERVCNCGLKESEHNVRHPFIPKQETLEEAGKNTTKKYINEREKQTAYLEFIEGAKWKAEISGQVDWKAVYEDSLSMQKCSNAGYESKIRELESKIERMYNEEEARAIWKAGKEYWKTSGASITFEELIEQFKKK